jgi:hypothetical protein
MVSRLSLNKASRSWLLIFPVATTSSRRGAPRSKWLPRNRGVRGLVTGVQVTILRDDRPDFGIGQRSERWIGRPVPLGKLRPVNRVVTARAQERSQPRRQLGVDQKLHPVPSGTRR